MNRVLNFGIIIGFIIFFALLFLFKISWTCPFQSFTSIACPGCGLTRSIEQLFQLHILESLHYNLLGIPLVIIMLYSSVRLCIDGIRDENHYLKQVSNFLSKNWFLILIVLCLNTVINQIRLS